MTVLERRAWQRGCHKHVERRHERRRRDDPRTLPETGVLSACGVVLVTWALLLLEAVVGACK